MSDLIDRQAAIDAIDKHCNIVCQYSKKQRSVMCGACPLGTAFDVIEDLPSAESVQHGKWMWVDGVRCSQCNYKLETTGLPNYCPNCGADMRGEE